MTDLELLRTLIGDGAGAVWSDAELESCLARARERFAEDSGAFRSQASLLADESGVFELPDDYVGLVAAWNALGEPIERGSEELARRRFGDGWRGVAGWPSMMLDGPGVGLGRLVPNPHGLQDVVELEVELVGLRDFGTLEGDGPGVTVEGGLGVADGSHGLCGEMFEPSADMQYARRMGDGDRLPDQMTLCRLAAHYALLSDTELSTPDGAAMQLAQYRYRLGVLRQTLRARGSLSSSGRFF